jgi:AcrR family transcriptional regulator
MKTQQRIYDAAKHAFLKFGYHGTTIEQIARYAGSGKAMVHYYFRTKEQLYTLVFTEYVKHLFTELNQQKIQKSHPYKQGIEYPELYEVAWFVANEFRTNRHIAQKTINGNEALKTIFARAYKNIHWVAKFHNLITAQLKDIFIKNNVLIPKIRKDSFEDIL